MRKLLTLLVLTLAIGCYAADTREVLIKGFKFYQDQGIKNYSCQMKMTPANALIASITTHWQDTGKTWYDLEFSPNCPDAQKQMMKDAYKEMTKTAEQMVDDLLKDFNVTELKDTANAISVTMEPKDAANAMKKQVFVYEKNYKLIGSRMITENPGISMDTTTKYSYTKSGTFDVIEKVEGKSKMKMKNPAPGATGEIEQENSTITIFENYKVNQ